MIKYLRNKTVQRRVFFVTLLMILPAFAFWGIQLAQDEKKTPGVIGRIEGKKIPTQKFIASVSAIHHQGALLYGKRFKEIAPFINIPQSAWDRLLLLQYAKSQKIKVSDEEVVNWIARQPLFNQNGAFDKEFYKRFVTEYLRADVNAFDEEIRQLLTMEKLKKELGDKIQISEQNIQTEYDKNHGRRDIEYVLIEAQPQNVDQTITDEELKKIYEERKPYLVTPARVNIEYVAFDKPPEEASSLESSTLEEISEKFHLPIKETGFFSSRDSVPGVGLSLPFIQTAFSLSDDTRQASVQTDKEFYVIRLKAKEEQKTLTLDQSRESLTKNILGERAHKLSFEKAKQITSQNPGGDLTSIASKENLKLYTIKEFKSRSYAEAVGESGAFSETVFSLKENQISEPIMLEKGTALIQVIKTYPLSPQDEEYLKQKEELKTNLSKRALSEKLDELLKRLRTSSFLDQEVVSQLFSGDNNEKSETSEDSEE